MPLGGIAARRFALAFVPPLVAGAVLTLVFVGEGLTPRLPAVWLLLYGAAVASGGALSVRVVPLIGVACMVIGVAAFASPCSGDSGIWPPGSGAATSSAASSSRGSTVGRPALDRPPATPRRKKTQAPAPLALDRVIHERLRLGIISALAVNDRLTFNELKQLLHTTDGNLSVHARKLEDAEYISCEKTFDGRVPRTEFRVTAAGRRALDKYLAHMEAIIDAVKPRQ